MTVSLIGSGTQVAANNIADNTIPLHASTAIGDTVILFCSSEGNGTLTPAVAYSVVDDFIGNSSDTDVNNVKIALQQIATVEDASCAYAGGISGHTLLFTAVTVRSSNGWPVLLTNESTLVEQAAGLAAVTPPGSDAPANSLVVVYGNYSDDITGHTTLTGDGLTWANLFPHQSSTSGGDSSQWADYAIVGGSPVTLTNKTFSTSGGAGGGGNNFSGKMYVFEEVEPSAATLSSPTPSGTLGTSTTATLGATTDTDNGTLYGVVDVAANMSGITAAQIIAGDNANDDPAVASNSGAISTTTPSVGVTGLTAATLYSYALVQNNGADSNVVTGTFTTAAAALTISTVPASVASLQTGLSITGTNFSGSGNTVNISDGINNANGTITAENSTSITFTAPDIQTADLKPGAITITVSNSGASQSDNDTSVLTVESGWQSVVIVSQDTSADEYLDTSPTPAGGDLWRWESFLRLVSDDSLTDYGVTVDDDCAYEIAGNPPEGAYYFTFNLYDNSDNTWGAEDDELITIGSLPVITNVEINTSGTQIARTFSQVVQINSGDDGFTANLSGGAVTETYLSGDGTNTIIWSLSRLVFNTETGTDAYINPGDGIEAVSDGDDVPNYSGFGITNLSTVVVDTTPTQFTFADQTNVAVSTVVQSNTITVAGINSAADISISSSSTATYSINGGAATSSPGTVDNGDTVSIYLLSDSSADTTASALLTIGGISDTFSVTTGSVVPTTEIQYSDVAFYIDDGLAAAGIVGSLSLLGTITYSIESGNTDSDFSIAASTGIISVANALSYNRTPIYTLVVRATDASDNTVDMTVTINVSEAGSTPSISVWTIIATGLN